jgi:hypothetical protein
MSGFGCHWEWRSVLREGKLVMRVAVGGELLMLLGSVAHYRLIFPGLEGEVAAWN